MNRGLTISAISHAAVLLWALVSFGAHPPPATPTDSLPVDIISSTEFSQLTAGARNAPPAPVPRPVVDKVGDPKHADDATPKVSDKQEVVTAAAPPPEPAPPPVVLDPKTAPTPPAAAPEPQPREADKRPPDPKNDPIADILKKSDTKKADAKKVVTKAPPKKQMTPPQPTFDADRISALLDRRDPQRRTTTGEVPNPTATLGVANANAPRLSQNEIDALRARIQACWSVPAGAADAKDLIVQVRILFRPDGSLQADPMLLNHGASPFFQVAAEAALNAIRRCAPYTFLPAAKYEAWKDVEVTFDPRDMFRG